MRSLSTFHFALLATLLVIGTQADAKLTINSVTWNLSADAVGINNYSNLYDTQHLNGTLSDFHLHTRATADIHVGAGYGESNLDIDLVGDRPGYYRYYLGLLVRGGQDANAFGIGNASFTVNFTTTGTTTIEFVRFNGSDVSYNTMKLESINPLDTNFNNEYNDVTAPFSPLLLEAGTYRATVDLTTYFESIFASVYLVDPNIEAFSASVPEVGTFTSFAVGLIVLFVFHPRCRTFLSRRMFEMK